MLFTQVCPWHAITCTKMAINRDKRSLWVGLVGRQQLYRRSVRVLNALTE
jgi:G:T-mismatch repair DNA endonuclease (very short patch repair protein)